MEITHKRTAFLANARSFLAVAFGVSSFVYLLYDFVVLRLSHNIGATYFLTNVDFFVMRAVLLGLMVYSGVKSSSKNPFALFGLNVGIGVSCIYIGLMNIPDYYLAKGDWKDLVAAFLFLPLGLVILFITLYLKDCPRSK